MIINGLNKKINHSNLIKKKVFVQKRKNSVTQFLDN
jgi:hypothetical protein